MDNQTVQKIKDLILQHESIGVLVGPNPSLDKMAAGLGLYLTIKQMGKNVVIASPTEPIVAVSNLVGIDKVQKSLGSGEGGDLTVSFPYQEGEIDKVSYTLENGRLNIVVKAGEKGLHFAQNDVKFERTGGAAPSLLFFVGIARMSEVASLYQPGEQAVTIVNLDNEAENEKYGDLPIIDTRWSSVSEQVADFVTLLEPQIEVDRDIAQDLLDGISFATDDFRSPKTSFLAFEVAGILMKKGAIRPSLVTTSPVQNASNFLPGVQQPAQPAAPIPPVTQQVPVQRTPAPVEPAPVQQPAQQPSQPQQEQAPSDWLAPKVYKGSTIL